MTVEDQEQGMKLEDLQPDAAVRGIMADSLVTVVSVESLLHQITARYRPFVSDAGHQQQIMSPGSSAP